MHHLIKNQQGPEKLVLTGRELADLLSVSERHLWTMNDSGRLGPRPLRFGRAVRWVKSEVHAWLNAGAPSRENWQEARVDVAATESSKKAS